MAKPEVADILLYRGTSWFSKGIMFIDKSEVSHAALYLGENIVGEAISEGLVRRDLPASIQGAEWVKACYHAGKPPGLSPVINKADEYIKGNNRYAYEEIILLAFLCLQRQLTGASMLGKLIRGILDHASHIITEMLDGGKEPMICSEFVYRCYDEAVSSAGDPYTINIYGFITAGEVKVRFMGKALKDSRKGMMQPKGRGIHPGSILAKMAHQTDFNWASAPVHLKRTANFTRKQKTIENDHIEELLAKYMREIQELPRKKGAVAGIDAIVASKEIQEAVNRFATALYMQRKRGGIRSFNGEAVMNNLLKATSDFVTPGDLYRSDSLQRRGDLDLP